MDTTKNEKPFAERAVTAIAVTVIATVIGGLIAGPAGAAIGAKAACGCGGVGCC